MEGFAEGYRALIQGASRGIGLAITERLLADPRCGHVFATARHVDSDGLLELEARHPGRVSRIVLDVGDDESIEAARALVADATDRLHLLFNVAGVLHDGEALFPEKRLQSLNRAALERSFTVNAFGPMLVGRAFLPLLNHGERAVLANMSARVGSIADNRLGGWYAYRAAKAAQNQFTRTLAVEAARSAKRLIVLALHPGTTDTALSGPFQKNVPPEKLFSVARTTEQLLDIIDGVTREDSGRFIAWDGRDIPW